MKFNNNNVFPWSQSPHQGLKYYDKSAKKCTVHWCALNVAIRTQ